MVPPMFGPHKCDPSNWPVTGASVASYSRLADFRARLVGGFRRGSVERSQPRRCLSVTSPQLLVPVKASGFLSRPSMPGQSQVAWALMHLRYPLKQSLGQQLGSFGFLKTDRSGHLIVCSSAQLAENIEFVAKWPGAGPPGQGINNSVVISTTSRGNVPP